MFGAIPAPFSVVGFGVVRRVRADALGFPVRVSPCKGFFEGIGGREVNYFRVPAGGKKQLLQALWKIHTLLDSIELKCLGR